MKTVILFAVRAYQAAVSPFLGHRCRFVPSCSSYMVEAVQQKGARRGLGLGLKRIARCHPWGGSGYDPVHSEGKATLA